MARKNFLIGKSIKKKKSERVINLIGKKLNETEAKLELRDPKKKKIWFRFSDFTKQKKKKKNSANDRLAYQFLINKVFLFLFFASGESTVDDEKRRNTN